VALLGLTAAAPPAPAQVTVHVGVVASSNLVSDSIVTPVSVRPNPALAAGVAFETRLDRYRLGAALTVSRSDVVSREPLSERHLTTLTVWHPSVSLRQTLSRWLSGEARLGLIIFDPSVTAGTLFRDGTPIQPALGLGFRAERRFGRSIGLGLAGHYDLHRFSTPRLRAEGFTGQSFVHRFTALVSIRQIATYDRTPQ
jgi:hypothetical protein